MDDDTSINPPNKKKFVFEVNGIPPIDLKQWGKNLKPFQDEAYWKAWESLYKAEQESFAQADKAVKKIKNDYYGSKKDPGKSRAFRSYAKKKGLIIPPDFDNFLKWYINVRYPDATAESIAEIELNDFVLYHKFQETKLLNLEIQKTISVQKSINQITLKDIALKLFYEGIIVNKVNADQILRDVRKEYKVVWISSSKLYQEFNYYSSKANRTAPPETSKKLENKKKLFEKVIKLLKHKSHKSKALQDLNEMEIKGKNYTIQRK